jgi:hypothetical protein
MQDNSMSLIVYYEIPEGKRHIFYPQYRLNIAIINRSLLEKIILDYQKQRKRYYIE